MNRSILINAIMFGVGAGVGSVVTWRLLKTKYEQLVQEEIESVVEVFSRDNMTGDDDEYGEDESEEDESENVDPEREEYKNIARSAGYTNNDEEEEDEDMVEPYVIVPEEFDENGYDTVTLYYYEDGIVETMLGKEVLDEDTVDEWVGLDSLTHFGEYEDDSVFVRNDSMRVDFEILKAGTRYSEDN